MLTVKGSKNRRQLIMYDACINYLTGAGVGGEYPLAATVTSESSSAASRGKLMAAVFAMQGVSV